MKQALIILASAALLLAPLSAQDEGAGLRPANVPKGPAPKLADGRPDFSGVWSPDRNFIYDINDALKKGDTLPIQPWALDLTKKRPSHDDPEANCLPTGVPRMAPYPWSIVQGPKDIYVMFEGN